MRVLTWNLFHGRSVPDRPREQLDAFAALLASWPWEVALLQEVPPWWAPPLARATDAHARTVLTSRTALLGLRRALARRRPDLLKSNGGGANVILVRGAAPLEHRRHRLRWLPERRVVHGVRLAGGVWVANVHCQGRGEHRAQADTDRAARAVLAWCEAGPAVLGGDLNTPQPVAPGFRRCAWIGVDHVLARGFAPAASGRPLARRGLSDHAPLFVELRKEHP